MPTDKIHIEINNTTKSDLPDILWLFDQAMSLQGKNGYKVWNNIDEIALERDIENKLQYKIARGNEILCIFSIQYSDPLIWRDRDNHDAIYLHRIVVHPHHKGNKLFEKVLSWIKAFAIKKKLKFIRMDTWAENEQLVKYYKSFGFEFIENYTTSNASELPSQNRNLNVALLEMKLNCDGNR